MLYITKRYCFNEYIYFIVSLVFFRIVLDFSYVKFVSPIYFDSFLSFKVNVDVYQYMISWVLYLSILFVVNIRVKKVSDYFFLSSVLYIIAPLTSIYGIDLEKNIFPILVSIGAIVFVFLICRKVPFIKVPKIPIFVHGNVILLILSWGGVSFLLFWYVLSGAVGNLNYLPSKMYETRALNGIITDIGILSYFNLWVYKFFSIFLICYNLHKKKYLIVLFLFCIQLFFYGINNHRITLFLPLLALIIWYYFNNTDKLIVLPLLHMIVIIISYLMYALFGYDLAASILIRRVFYVPAGLTFEWFNFFSNHPYVLWSDKISSFFITYPYELNIPHLVGKYLLSDTLAANNGYISSGYAHAGIIGVLIYSGILGYTIKFLDVMGRRFIPIWFLLALTAGPLRTVLTDSDLFTSMVSHGLIIAILILIFFRDYGCKNINPAK